MSPAQCDGCSSKFSWLRKRRTCPMCRSVYCSSCMQRLRLCAVGRHCLRCARLGTVHLDRAALQQMTVRDLKHIMKIVDVSPATCREKSDLVDTILQYRGPAGQLEAPPVDRSPVPVPVPAAAPAPRLCRGAARDSIRVTPYDSIRVRAVDESQSSPPTKRPDAAASTPDSAESPSPGRPYATPAAADTDADGFVVVDVETVDDASAAGEAGRVRIADPADAADAAESASAVAAAADAQEDRSVYGGVAGGRGAEQQQQQQEEEDVEVEVVVVKDPDDPESESTTIEAKKEQRTDDPESEAELVDLSHVTDVAQLPSEEAISRLTVRQCKRLLQQRRTEYKDVIEKDELLRRVRLLWRETKRNSDALASASDRDICKICMDSLVDCVMLECGHMATCTACGKQMSECPICRKYVIRVVHVFRS